jgi:acyl-CoA reductase-like NAD-dependent aldehyde dehydrogenase
VQARREDAASVTEAIIAHQGIRKIDFIGSAGVGKLIGKLASEYLKPVLMELGGKASAIVLDDADLEVAANTCVVGGKLTP